MKRYVSVLLTTLVCCVTSAQTTIRGKVELPDGSAIENAIITIKSNSRQGESIIANTFTNENGQYEISICNGNSVLVLYVSHPNIKTIRKETANTSQTLDFVAEQNIIQIQEVIVRPNTISVNGDTLSYDFSYFRDKNDKKLRETLERLPGISFSSTGQITYNGREISEFQIEGNNLFDGKYTIALERIDPKEIMSIDIMQNHQPIRALKDSRFTSDVALNLKLSSESKNTLFGKAELGVGARGGENENALYQIMLDAGAFNAKSQFFVTAGTNNQNADSHSVYASPAMTIHDNVLSSTIPQTPLLHKSHYQTNSNKALSLNGLYRKSEAEVLTYSLSGIEERSRGHAILENTYYLNDADEEQHIRDLLFRERLGNTDVLLKYENNKENYFVQNQLTGQWCQASPFVDRKGMSYSIHEDILQKNKIVKNSFRLIRKWNGARGIDTRIELLYADSQEELSLQQTEPEEITGKEGISATQHVRQKTFFLDCRQELLSTIRIGALVVDPYWFGIIDKDRMNANLYAPGLLQTGTAEVQDNLSYLRGKAGIGLMFHTKVTSLTVRGYLPLVYSYFSIYSPFLRENKGFLQLHPSIWIECPLFSRFSLQLNCTKEMQDNKPQDYLHSVIARNSYEITQTQISTIAETSYNKVCGKLNYINPFSMFFANLHLDYTYLHSPMMVNRIIKEGMIHLDVSENGCSTNSINMGCEISKTFFWKKANVSLSINSTHSSSAQMQNGTVIPYTVQGKNLAIRGELSPMRGLKTKIQSYFYHGKTTLQGNAVNAFSTRRISLLGTILATFKSFTISANGMYMSENKSDTFLGNLQLIWKRRKTEWALDIHNLLNASKLNIVSVTGQEKQSETYYLTPRSVFLSIKFHL